MELDELIEEAGVASERVSIAKVSYTHTDMIDFIIANPHVSQKQLAARYGYTQAWVCTIIGSDAFQTQLAARREEIVGPELRATVEERIKGLTILSITRLGEELSKPVVAPLIALRAAEFGAKALGLGGHRVPEAPPTDGLARLAERLLSLNQIPKEHIDGEAERVG